MRIYTSLEIQRAADKESRQEDRLLKTIRPVHMWTWLCIGFVSFVGCSLSSDTIPPPKQTSRASSAILSEFAGSGAKSSTEAASTQARLLAGYGQLPLPFEANRGQVDAQVEFLSRGHGYTLFLTSTEAVLSLRTPAEDDKIPLQEKHATFTPRPSEQQVVRMQLVGANARPAVVGLQELPGKSNYFLGSDPTQWQTDVPTFARVKYEAVYPGIDLVYYGNQGQLEYDFVVAPGVDPSVIQLAFSGSESIDVDEQGDLRLHLASGEVRFQQPKIYQEINGSKQPIEGQYVLQKADHTQLAVVKVGKPESARVSFQIAAYDPGKPLIIDPILSYSTYLGCCSDPGNFRDIAVDRAGNMYVTSNTTALDFPTTTNAFQVAHSGGSFDTFVTKFNSTGSALLYSTYLGGSGEEWTTGLAVDSTGNGYVIGYTDSTDFPTVNAFQAVHAGGTNPRQDGGIYDIFVAKLNSTGSGLLYSTYLGGNSARDEGWDITVNSAGEAYVTGATASTDFPTTVNAPQQQPALDGSQEAFVTKFNATGDALLYSTYLGGSGGADTGTGITVDSTGAAYLAGTAGSADFPTTPGVFQELFPGGSSAAFVTRINPAGDTLLYSTFIGGNGNDQGWDIAIDGANNAYITGRTGSTNLSTVTAVQPSLAGNADAFVAKLNPPGSALVYATYLGGSARDHGWGIAADSAGNAYVTGVTGSADFPIADALQATLNAVNGADDAFVVKLEPHWGYAAVFDLLGGECE